MASKRDNRNFASGLETVPPSKKIKSVDDLVKGNAIEQTPDVDNTGSIGKMEKIQKSEYFDKTDIPKRSMKKKSKKTNERKPIIAPQNWKEQYDNIKKMRMEKSAEVDSMGVQSNYSDELPPNESRFHVLISLVLSSRTRDTVNSAVMDKLRKYGLTIEHIRKTSVNALAKLIHPVGFKFTKAKHIKKIVEILHEQYADDVPGDYESIIALPGVGPKMAILMMRVAWNKTVGISVDTHVHRISNRLGWTGDQRTSMPEQTRGCLEDWLPKEYWGEINVMLVGFGQQTCKPINPLCNTCLNRKICSSSSCKD